MQPTSSDSTEHIAHLEGMVLPIGNYRLEQVVSVSNMSAIYKAVDLSSKQYVAIKILLTKRYLQRFRNEVRISWGHSRNIASALRYELDGERLADGTVVQYMVMKWLFGQSLSERIKDFKSAGTPTPELVRFCDRLLSKLAPALDELHAIGLVHLDVKPSNILFNSHDYERDEPYLIDFGIAQWLHVRDDEPTTVEDVESEPNTRMTSDNEFVVDSTDRPGTANYMPPEQWKGLVRSGATDQYALAVTIYEVLSGRISPFHEALMKEELTTGSKSSPRERRVAWQRAHEHEQPTPIQTYRSDLPKAVWRVLARAMSKTPEERFPTVGAFHKAFHHAVLPMLDNRMDADQPTAPETNGAFTRRRSWAALWVVLAAGLIIAGAVLIYPLVTSPGVPTPDGGLAVAAVTTETVEATAEMTRVTATPETEVAAADEETLSPTPEATTESTATPPGVTATSPATAQPSPTPASATATRRASTATLTRTPAPTATPTATETLPPTRTRTPRPSITPSVTRTASPTQSATRTPAPTRTTVTASPTRTATITPTQPPTQTRTASPIPRTPTSTPAQTHSAREWVQQLSAAARSANNFDCAGFMTAYEGLRGLLDSDPDGATVESLFSGPQSAPFTTLVNFCQRPPNRDDVSVRLPSALANDAFRDVRTHLRDALNTLEG